MISLSEMLAFLALACIFWFWFDSLRAREAGVDAAREACRREGLQLLDETVVGRGVRPARDENGRLRLQRAFDFDYSRSGFDRHHGSVVLRGREVVLVDLGRWQVIEGGLAGHDQ